LIELVTQMLSKSSITRAPSIHDQLSEAGLTSLDMVNLMIAVEAEFDITIPAADITRRQFPFHLDDRGLDREDRHREIQ